MSFRMSTVRAGFLALPAAASAVAEDFAKADAHAPSSEAPAFSAVSSVKASGSRRLK